MPSPACNALPASPAPELSPLAKRVLAAVRGSKHGVASAALAWDLRLKTMAQWNELVSTLAALALSEEIHLDGYPSKWFPGKGSG